ncbi:MAG: DUF5069 domain-containing protein [Nibricoccus sp.]
MKHYDFQKNFRALYDKTVELYAKGQRDPAACFTSDEKAFLAENGLTPQAMFDYAEDHNKYGEPGLDFALGIETIRRDYFLLEQLGMPSTVLLDETKLPAKTESIRGVEWLPRIIPKAKAKLRGELPSSLMYCCGGDRKFLKANDINPVEFLGVIRQFEKNDSAIIDWVVRRSATGKAAPRPNWDR